VSSRAARDVREIDLNVDCGESYGPWRMGHDSALMPWVSSVNLACGGHAGDPLTMLASVRLAHQHQLAIGAHPSYPDLLGFGRRSLPLSDQELYAWTLAQIGSLRAIVQAEGGQLRHVKPHGALYHDLDLKPALASAFVAAVAGMDRSLRVVGAPNGGLAHASHQSGLAFAAEGFVERGYGPDGRLLPRGQAGAQLHEVAAVLAQASALALQRGVRCGDGTWIALDVQTLCLHGDHPDAASLAQAVRTHLQAQGVCIRALDSR